MGGKNHQPTNQIQLIAPSALLSKKLGQATIAVTEANNFLEDAIIASMNRLYVETLVEPVTTSTVEFLTQSIASLTRSRNGIAEIEVAFDNLLTAAKIEGYTGNPLASSVSSFDLKAKFERFLVRPAINVAAWEAVESRVRASNVLATLRWEREQFDGLRAPTDDLLRVMTKCLNIAREQGDRAFVEAVECNRVELRQYYAQVFSLWNYLDAMFLYSALIMTELFYRVHEYEALTEWTPNTVNPKSDVEVTAVYPHSMGHPAHGWTPPLLTIDE